MGYHQNLPLQKIRRMVHPIAPHGTFSVISLRYIIQPKARNTAGAFIGGGATISTRPGNQTHQSAPHVYYPGTKRYNFDNGMKCP